MQEKDRVIDLVEGSLLDEHFHGHYNRIAVEVCAYAPACTLTPACAPACAHKRYTAQVDRSGARAGLKGDQVPF